MLRMNLIMYNEVQKQNNEMTTFLARLWAPNLS